MTATMTVQEVKNGILSYLTQPTVMSFTIDDWDKIIPITLNEEETKALIYTALKELVTEGYLNNSYTDKEYWFLRKTLQSDFRNFKLSSLVILNVATVLAAYYRAIGKNLDFDPKKIDEYDIGEIVVILGEILIGKIKLATPPTPKSKKKKDDDDLFNDEEN